MSMRTKVTLADVAHEANVSSQTVSRVVNNKPGIRPETRQAVLDAIDHLGYRPNIIARSLVTNRTLTLGMIVPDIGNPFFADLVRGAEEAAREHGYHIMLCNTDLLPEREESAILALEDKWVDGIILAWSRLSDERLRKVVTRRSAVVLAGNAYVDGAAGAVRDSDEEIIRLILDHLVSRGKRKISYLAGRPQGPAYPRRRDAYLAITRELGLSESDARVAVCAPDLTGGHEAASREFAEDADVDAFVCFNDLVAIGAIRACVERGLAVPDDVHVVGIDDNVIARMVEPPLTTVQRSTRAIGSTAAHILVKHLRGEDQPTEHLLPVSLIVRASSP